MLPGVQSTGRTAEGGRVSTCERYKLNCHQCGHVVEIPAGAPNEPGHACPQCGTGVRVDWRGSEPPRAARRHDPRVPEVVPFWTVRKAR